MARLAQWAIIAWNLTNRKTGPNMSTPKTCLLAALLSLTVMIQAKGQDDKSSKEEKEDKVADL
jgi:hypothetical protein